jgi:hypothetical protein
MPGNTMQLLVEKDVIQNIQAPLNYIVDTGIPPVRYIDWPEMEHAEVPPKYEPREMIIRNGRPLREIFNLDTHGFVFAAHDTAVQDFTDADERGAFTIRRWRRLSRSTPAHPKCGCSTTPCASATSRR